MTKKAALFPGQGAQSVGMGKTLVEAFPACRKLADTASDVLGFDLPSICFDGPEDSLTRSNNAQPAIFLTSAMCFEAAKAAGDDASFDFLAGLSSGEWGALFVAGVLDFRDTLRVLQARGQYMQEACEQTAGGMISILGLPLEEVRKVAEESGLCVANQNSPVQTVLSGAKDLLAGAEKMALEKGAKRAIILNVAGAFHSPLMTPAADRLAGFLADLHFAAPKIPVISNVTACPHTADTDEIKAVMVKQVTSPVRWVETIEWLKSNGVKAYTEFGPGKVLTGLVKRMDRAATLRSVQGAADIEQ